MLTDLRLQNRTIANQIDFESQNRIITGRNTQEQDWNKLIEPGDFVVKEDGVVTLTAANSIIFEEGTIIEEGGALIANITGSVDQISCSGNGPLPPFSYGYANMEGPDPYCPGQRPRTYKAEYITSSLTRSYTARWALDNEELDEGIDYKSYLLPVELNPGGHTILCEVRVSDEDGNPIERSLISKTFMVLEPDDETCVLSQQMLVPEFESQISLNPNPATGTTTIEIKILQDGPVTISLLTLEGSFIEEIYFDKDLKKGDYQYQLNTSNLKTGIYLVSLKTQQDRETQRLIVVN